MNQKKYDDLSDDLENILVSRCPDGRKGCIVAHSPRNVADAMVRIVLKMRSMESREPKGTD